MKKTILAIFVTLSILLTAVIPAIGSCVKNDPLVDLGDPYDNPIELVKQVWNEDLEEWVDEIEAEIDEIVRFKIIVTYHDTDGPPSEDPPQGQGYTIRWINVNDTLPSGLDYFGNASVAGPDVSPDLKEIKWNLTGLWLEDGESSSIEFDAIVTDYGTQINFVDVTAQEKCVSEWRYNQTTATVEVESLEPDYVEKDVDDDGIKEKAIDMNYDSSDGYEIYQDEDGNSTKVISVDANGDGFIDHFIDINNSLLDWDEIPEVYWDPVLDIVDYIYVADVDYDGTDEWVFDSDGDYEKDTYHDDGEFYPYEAYELIVNVNGNGTIEINPTGNASPYYLKDFVVTIVATPLEDAKFVNWTGDIKSNASTLQILINKTMNITANFEDDDNNTNDTTDPTVTITKPADNKLYKDDLKVRDIIFKTRVIGDITIEADAEDPGEDATGIEKVVFNVEGMDPVEVSTPPYKFNYDQDFFLPHLVTVEVTAYDKEGNSASDEVTFWKMSSYNFIRNHPKLSLLLLAGAGGLLLLKRLTGGDDNETEPDDTEPDDGDGDDIDKTPNADAGNDYYGAPGVKIEFDASRSSDPNGDQLQYHWDFGDGSSGSGEKVTHVYQKEGTYIVILTVTDESGLSDKDTINVEISSDYKGDDEIDDHEIFWYIVTGLSILLLGAIVALYLGRKYYV